MWWVAQHFSDLAIHTSWLVLLAVTVFFFLGPSFLLFREKIVLLFSSFSKWMKQAEIFSLSAFFSKKNKTCSVDLNMWDFKNRNLEIANLSFSFFNNFHHMDIFFSLVINIQRNLTIVQYLHPSSCLTFRIFSSRLHFNR